MIIQATKLRIIEKDACNICKVDNNGLLGKVGDKLLGRPTENEIISCRKFYYPYYCILVKVSTPTYKNVVDTTRYEKLVVDGCFGYLHYMEGIPETDSVDIPLKDIAAKKITQAQAHEKVSNYIKNKIFKKRQLLPNIEFRNTLLIYKPLFAVLCKKGNKKFYRVVDGELGVKDFTFDVYYRKITFLED